MYTLALSIAEIWSRWLWPILQLAIGLGLVIFVHELGHFLAAKWSGIKVEEFAIGFGKRIWSRRRGETEYRINALPLGGYVKMLGQDDFRPVTEAPRDASSWQATPVGKRLVVLSAGVVMNVVFAAVLFIIVGLAGIRFPASVVGGVDPDFPAARAKIIWEGPAPTTSAASSLAASASAPAATFVTYGLEPGDQILSIDGRKISRMDKVMYAATLARPGEVFKLTVARDFDGHRRIGTAEIGVEAVKDDVAGKRLAFGISRATTLVLGSDDDQVFRDSFQDGDEVLAVNGRPIRHAWDLPGIEKTLTGAPVAVTVQRGPEKVNVEVQPRLIGGPLEDVLYVKEDGSRVYGRIVTRTKDKIVIRQADGAEREFSPDDVDVGKDGRLDILGASPRLKILAIEKGSPAAKAGLEPGDVVVRYGDRPDPSFREFLDVNDRAADTGTDIVVLRDGKTSSPMPITPTKHERRVVVGLNQSSDLAHTVVAAVRSGSPAAEAGIQPGDVIEEINGRPVNNWIGIFNDLKRLIGKEVSITCRRGTGEHTAQIGKLTEDQFNPDQYQFTVLAGPRPLRELTVRIVKRNPLAAIGWGFRETADFIGMTYAMVRGWLTRTISGRQFSGPVGIVAIGIQAGRRSSIMLVYLMAVIGVSVAVINFLPLPLLDGGHVVLVLIEKVRGRPLSLKVQAAIQIVGLVMIAALFLALTWSDISKWLWGRW